MAHHTVPSYMRPLAAIFCLCFFLSGCVFSGTQTLGSQADPGPTLIPNPYTTADFAWRDGYLTCISGQSQLGIDVSSHQGEIDWPVVAQAGISFAMIRAGYRGWGQEGILMADTMFETNLQGALQAGLQVGVYFYSQAISVEEAREEAQFLLTILDGAVLSMPVVFDWEIFSESGRTALVDRTTLNACARTFCREIADAGYTPMLYFNTDVGSRLLDLPVLQEEGYPFWLALYGEMTYAHRIDMWQYSQSGRVKGIEGSVDLNLYFTYD